MGMKASDNSVARLCQGCHDKKIHSRLGRTLSVRAIVEPLKHTEQLVWFIAMQEDALFLNRSWIEHLEAKR